MTVRDNELLNVEISDNNSGKDEVKIEMDDIDISETINIKK